MSRARNILISSKGIPTRDPIADLMGQKLAAMSAPVVDITGTLPLSFTARAQQALRNYRFYGTSEGAGGETENLFNYRAKDTANGYVANAYLTNAGEITSSDAWWISEYIPVEENSAYTVFTGTYNNPSACFYDSNKEFLAGYKYGNQSPRNVTSPNNARYARISVRAGIQANVQFYKGTYTTGPAYQPYGYQIPLTVTSGQNTDTYPLYIGSTKLGAEEYVDYESGKVYKEPPNIFDYTAKDTNKGYIANTYIKTDGSTISSSSAWVSEYIEVTEGETYALTNFATTAAAYAMCRYDASKNFVSGSATKFLFRTVIPSGVKYIRITVPDSLETTASIKLDRQIPTDPPAPFPAITAYEGENTLSSSETVGSVTVTGRISEIPEL